MIPRVARFLWVGRALPWVHLLALDSARRHGGFDRVELWHTDELEEGAVLAELRGLPTLAVQRLDELALLERARGPRLVDLYRDLSAPAARVNVLRAALLACDGGVYLDLDTVTVGDFAALLASRSAFVGEEHVAWPAAVRASRAPSRWAGALLRDAARDLLRRAPRGHRAFRRVERWYPRAANNAVLGAPPRHALLEALLDAMLEVAPERRRVRFALGTHLLQQTLPGFSEVEVRRLSPAWFYPLGPEISEHWFRADRGVSYRELLRRETLVVHWYASVRNARLSATLDAGWVSRERRCVPFAALAADFGPPLGAGT